jgi:RNA polymerase sigma factor (sigma-70 family)
LATASLNAVLGHLRRVAVLQGQAGKPDAQLLESFIRQQDEEAFETLVRRHGPMVLAVCRRTLPNPHDAEDAFQATFLVLARKASAVRPRERVANWLHGVAYRTSLKARATRARIRAREKQMTQFPEPEARQPDLRNDLRRVLDEEVSRLPEVHRLPLILCDLERKTIREATQQLGWPQGTVAGRLARARKTLARRLTQRGVVLSAGSLAVALPETAMAACPSNSLGLLTVRAAGALARGQAAAAALVSPEVAALTEGVLQTMILSTSKRAVAAAALLVAVVLGTGTARNLAQGQGADPAPSPLQGEKARFEAQTPAPSRKDVGGARSIAGVYRLFARDNPDAGLVCKMEVIARDGNSFSVRGLDQNWSGEGKLDGRSGYYNWVFDEGQTGRTTFTIGRDGTLRGEVLGEQDQVNWSYLARPAGRP